MKQDGGDFTVFRRWRADGWGVYGAELGETVLYFVCREEAEARGRELASENGVRLWLQLTPRHSDAVQLADFR